MLEDRVQFQSENLMDPVEIFSHLAKMHIFVMIWKIESWVTEYEPKLYFSSKKDNLVLFIATVVWNV